MHSSIICVFMLLASFSLAQEVNTRKILEDGTLLKIYSNGDMELKFPEDKLVISTYITSEGEVKTEYQDDQSPGNFHPEEMTGSSTVQREQRIRAPANALLSVDISQLDDSTQKVFTRARIDYFKYFSEGYQHRQKVFSWQLLSSKIIFVVVVLLVFSGILFAAIQFYEGLKSSLKPSGQTTTFEAGKGGLKVSSPVLGVIILVISLVFFYLYLVYVYPIREIF